MQHAHGNQGGDALDDLLRQPRAHKRLLGPGQHRGGNEAGNHAAGRADVHVFQALSVAALGQVSDDGGNHQNGFQPFPDDDAERAQEREQPGIGGLRFLLDFGGSLPRFRSQRGLGFRRLGVQGFGLFQNQVLRAVGGGAVFVLLIFRGSRRHQAPQVGEIPIRFLPVF